MDIINRTLSETDGLNYAKVESILFRNLCILTKADVATLILFDQSNLHMNVKKTLPALPDNGKSGFHISNQIFQSLQGRNIEKWSEKFDFYHELLPDKISERIRKSTTNWLHLTFSFSGSTIAYALVHIVEKFDSNILRSFLPVTALILQRSFAFSNLKKTRLELNTVYGTSTDVIMLIDKDLEIIWLNRLGQYFFGNDIIGHKVYEVLHDGTPKKDDRIIKSLFDSGGSKEFERSIITSEGKIKNYSCVGNITGEDSKGNPNIGVIFFRDVTSQKRQKNNLLLLNDKINRCQKATIRSRSHMRLGKLYSEMNDDLFQGIENTKKDLQVLKEYVSSANPKGPSFKTELLQKIEQLSQSCTYSESIDNSFRNLVFIKQIRRELEPYNLNSSIQDLLHLIRPIKSKEIRVKASWGELPLIKAVSVEINTAIYELLNNAIEALTLPDKIKDGCIELSTWSDEEWVYLKIKDNGPGLDKAKILSIFDYFHSSKHHVTGIGAGLSVVQEFIVSRHNGNLSMDSDIGMGANFTISLPIVISYY